ncbi:hypothetical protein H8356DRAFT_1328632 [Neocallimastix lanati (nom. inval.)]|nr:hypothetical protein H8356DRAFT_1328632 [Neocallimastix sp. JGI-2020a]
MERKIVDIKGESNKPIIIFLIDYVGRILENISSELHSCIQQLNVTSYYIMAHSLRGMHALYYVNKYSNEITGIIDFDTTVPKLLEKSKRNENSFGAFNKAIINKGNIPDEDGLDIIDDMKFPKNMTHLYLIFMDVLKIKDITICYTRSFFLVLDIVVRPFLALVCFINLMEFNHIMNESDHIKHDLDSIDDMKFLKSMILFCYISTEYYREYSNYKQLHMNVKLETISNIKN